MSGLAQITLKNGLKVTGSDRSKSPITDKLESLGADIHKDRVPVSPLSI